MHAMQEYQQRRRKRRMIMAGSVFVVLVTAIACKWGYIFLCTFYEI